MEDKKLLRIADLTNQGMAIGMVRKAIERGDLPAYKLGHGIYLKPEEVDAWITSQKLKK